MMIKMDKSNKKNALPPYLVLASLLSGGLTIAQSIIYIVLSLLGIAYRFLCNATSPETTDGAGHFINMILRVYIQKNECELKLTWDNLTSADSIFVLNIVTLCAAVLTLIAAIVLITAIKINDKELPIYIAIYAYIGTCVASMVVDVTYAIHYGMDYTTLTNALNLNNPGLVMNYDRDVVRLGAMFLMTLTLKGFVAHAVNIVLIIIMLVYVIEYQQKEEHSIHRLGALNAYDQPRRQPDRQDSWQPEPQMFLALPRGAHTNPAYIDDIKWRGDKITIPLLSRHTLVCIYKGGDDTHATTDDNNSMGPRYSMREREPAVPDYIRSESWQPGVTSANGARPFSYLEEARRPATRPASPSPEPQWRRDWPPPVPAPDYSPHTPRRLKSALKPSYM